MEEDLFISQYLALVRRNWKLVVAGAGLGAVVGVILVLFVLPRQWRADAAAVFEAPSGLSSLTSAVANIPGLGTLAQKLGMGDAGSSVAMLALAFGESQTVRFEVIERLGLVAKLNAPSQHEADKRLARMTSFRLTDRGTLALSVTIAGTPRGVLPSKDDDLERRTLARDIVKEYLQVVQGRMGSLNLTRSQRKAAFLRERLDQVKSDLDEARQRWAAAQKDGSYVLPPPAVPPEVTTLAALEKELAMAQADELGNRQALSELKSELTQQDQMIVSTVVSQASEVASPLREQIALAQTELAALHEKGYSDEHPECRTLLARIKELKAQYQDEIAMGLSKQAQTESANPIRQDLITKIATAEADRLGASARAGAFRSAVSQVNARIAKLPGALEKVGGLLQEVEVKSAVYGVVANAYEMARAEAEEDAPQFTILDPPIIPPEKIAPSGTKVCLATIFIGLVLGIMAAPSLARRRRARQEAAQEAKAE